MRYVLDPSEGRHPALVTRPVWIPGFLPCERVVATGPRSLPAWIQVFTYDRRQRLALAVERSATTDIESRRHVHRYEGDLLVAVEEHTRLEPEQPWECQMIRYHHDADGHLRARSTWDGGESASASARVEYDVDEHGRRVGERLHSGDGSMIHAARYRLDERGRLLHQSHRVGGREQWTSEFVYAQDDSAVLVAERHSRDGETRYEYDGAGRLVGRVRRSQRDLSVVHQVWFTHDSDGRLVQEDIEQVRAGKTGQVRHSYRYD